METDNPFEQTRRIPPRGQQDAPPPGWPQQQQEQTGQQPQPGWPPQHDQSGQQAGWPPQQPDQSGQQAYTQPNPGQQGFAPAGWTPPQNPFGTPTQNTGYQYRQSPSGTGPVGTTGVMGTMGAQPMAATATADTVEEPGRRDIMKILRNVGIVCSALVGVVKVADMLGAFNGFKGSGTPNTSLLSGATGGTDASSGGVGPAPAGNTAPVGDDMSKYRPRPINGSPASIDEYVPSVAMAGDIAYVYTESHTAFAFDAVKGRTLWRQANLSAWVQTPVVSGTSVYIAADDGVQVRSTANGNLVHTWPYPDGTQFEVGSPILFWDNGKLFAVVSGSGSDPALARFDPATGKSTLIPMPTLGDLTIIEGPPAYGPGWFAIIDTDKNLASVDTATGKVVKTPLDEVTSPQATADGKTCYVVAQGSLFAYSMPDGAPKGQFMPPQKDAFSKLMGSIAVGTDHVYVQAESGATFACSKANIANATGLATLPNSFSHLAYVNGTGLLLAAHNSGEGVLALDGKSGEVKWFAKLPNTPLKDNEYKGFLRSDPAIGKTTMVITNEIDSPKGHYLYGISTS